jgi:ABC-2 type transport system ATP-binding protein
MAAIGSSAIVMRSEARRTADARPSAEMLAVSGLTKRYGDDAALADVSFAARRGEILGLIGPNGAGKTTLLEVVAGLIPADSGDVAWQGEKLPASRRREHIFYLPDGLRPYQDQLTMQVVGFFADVYGQSGHDVATAIAAVGLAPALPKRVRALSKGFARRLLLVIGLLTPHPVLLMDEPFDGFDLRQTREMCGVLRHQAESARSLVLAIHQLTDAERICDRFVLLADGRVRGIGTLDALRAQTGLADGDLEAMFLALT